MKRLFALAALAALFAAPVSAPAAANVIFNLSGVTLQGGGEVTGFITTSDDLKSIVDLSLSVPGATIGAFTFAPLTYSFSDAIYYQIPSNSYLRVDKVGGYQLQIAFGALTVTGANVVLQGSYDHSNNAGNRAIQGGAFVVAPVVDPTPAPEPASWTLALAGLGLIGAALVRRRAVAA